MTWTAPRTWIVGEVLTASLMNTHLRDNLLMTAPAKMTTTGDIIQAASANSPARLAIGTARQVLAVNSGATAVEYVASLQSLMTATGDLLYASSANTPARLAIGSSTNVLTVSGGVPAWAAAPAAAEWAKVQSGALSNVASIDLGASGTLSGYRRYRVQLVLAGSTNNGTVGAVTCRVNNISTASSHWINGIQNINSTVSGINNNGSSYALSNGQSVSAVGTHVRMMFITFEIEVLTNPGTASYLVYKSVCSGISGSSNTSDLYIAAGGQVDSATATSITELLFSWSISGSPTMDGYYLLEGSNS